MLAAQVAKNMGLAVLATTRNQQKEKKLLENGATHVLIDNGILKDKVQAIYPQGVDKVLELVGAITLKDSLQCVRPGGTVCMAGMLGESWVISEFAPMEFIPATVHLTAYDSGQLRSPAHVFQEFIDSVVAGHINLRVGKVFPLEEIVEAHRLMESNQADGKIVNLSYCEPGR